MFFDYTFFFNDTATTEIYTLSLHDALPIFAVAREQGAHVGLGVDHRLQPLGDGEGDVLLARTAPADRARVFAAVPGVEDRKSTRLNSSPPIYRMPSSA